MINNFFKQVFGLCDSKYEESKYLDKANKKILRFIVPGFIILYGAFLSFFINPVFISIMPFGLLVNYINSHEERNKDGK